MGMSKRVASGRVESSEGVRRMKAGSSGRGCEAGLENLRQSTDPATPARTRLKSTSEIRMVFRMLELGAAAAALQREGAAAT